MSTSNRVSRRFAALNNSDLITFTRNVVVKMTGNPAFTTPFVALADLTLAANDFSTAVEAALNGGKQQIAARDQARESLLALLRQEAAYVESITTNDLANLLSSGFDAVNTNRTQITLPKPNIADVENSASTQLTVKVEPVPTARAYEVRMSYGANGWQAAGVFTQARRIVLNDLSPGTTYTVQVRAIGGNTGASDWSDPVSHMSL